MKLILNIDTSIETASICLAKGGENIAYDACETQKEHASWLHPAIETMMKQSGHSLKNLDAIAITIGPGSYTGLRVGLSSAKGLCYALKIPMVPVGTLEFLAYADLDNAEDLVCPLIDARRMEVFTAVYDQNMNEVISPQALILSENSFQDLLENHTILFTGNAIKKASEFSKSPHCRFSDRKSNAIQLARLSHKKYDKYYISDSTYIEPLYIKNFHFRTY